MLIESQRPLGSFGNGAVQGHDSSTPCSTQRACSRKRPFITSNAWAVIHGFGSIMLMGVPAIGPPSALATVAEREKVMLKRIVHVSQHIMQATSGKIKLETTLNLHLAPAPSTHAWRLRLTVRMSVRKASGTLFPFFPSLPADQTFGLAHGSSQESHAAKAKV